MLNATIDMEHNLGGEGLVCQGKSVINDVVGAHMFTHSEDISSQESFFAEHKFQEEVQVLDHVGGFVHVVWFLEGRFGHGLDIDVG